MAEKVNQQQTLFKFISIRPPQLLSEVSKPVKFVFQPIIGGVFYNAVINRAPGEKKWEAMKIAAQSFTPYPLKDFESKFGEKIELAGWLTSNRSVLTSDEIYTRLQNVAPIGDTEIKNVWDNFYYQVIAQQDFYVKELLNELLVLQHVLVALKPESAVAVEENYSELANARSVLPVEMFVEDEDSEPAQALAVEEPLFNAKAVEESRESVFAEYAIVRNTKAIEELQQLERIYGIEYNTARV